MKFKDFTAGLNTLSPSEDIGANECESLLNVSFDEGSLLRSRHGFSTVRSATNVRKIYPFYVSGTLHFIYTDSGGLRDNGTVLDANFTGAFHADEYNDMLYMCNGTYYKRYDGTTLYNVGMAAPDAPTVVVNDQDTVVLDNFEADADDDPAGGNWTIAASPLDGGTNGAIAHDAGTAIEDTESLKVTVSENSMIRITRVFTASQNWAEFTSGEGDSTEDDYITFQVYVENADHLRYFQVIVDVDDGDFDTNFYKTGKVIQDATVQSILTTKYGLRLGGFAYAALSYTEVGKNSSTFTDFQNPVFPRQSAAWVMFKMPKGDFTKEGTDSTKNWSTVKALGFVIWSGADTDDSDLVLYIDNGRMRGAASIDGGFYGRYYFCAGYTHPTRDEYYEFSAESTVVDCNVNSVTVSAIPATFPDAQASHYAIFARKEDWANWFRVGLVAEGTTTLTTSYNDIAVFNNPELTEQAGVYPLPKALPSGAIKTRNNSNNTKPPVPDFITMHRGKMVMVVDNLIYHTKPGQPWACPTDNWIQASSTSDPIQGLYSDGANLTAHSRAKDFNYINVGDYSTSGMYMGYLAKGKRSVGCSSPHSIDSGIFASPFGISTFDGQSGLSLSDRVKPTYRDISSKTTLHGVVYEDMYLLINPGGNSIVMERVGNGTRFYEWAFISTARCCCVDALTNTLYIGTDTGIYKYDRSTYKDSEGSFTFTAWSKMFAFDDEEDRDKPLERATIRANTGGNTLSHDFEVDGTSVLADSFSNTAKAEKELHLAISAVGSFVQVKLSGTVSKDAPIRIYQVEIS